MYDIATIILPVFGMIAIGWLGAHTKLLTDRAGDGLSDFVFAIAVPALIFRTLSAARMTDVSPWGYWIAYFGGAAVAWIIGQVAAGRLFGRGGSAAAIHGFTAAQSNTVLVGIPVILRAYGDEGTVPLFLLLAIHLPIMMTVATLLVERAAAREGGGKADWKRLGRTLATHPILIALAAGVLSQLLGIKPGGALKTIIDEVGDAAVPCALIAMGYALKRYGVRGDLGPAVMLGVLKLVVHPLVVFVIARYVLSMPPAWSGVAVLFAAMPSGINAYLLASRYGMEERATSSALALSTAFSVITVSGWLLVLGLG